MALINDLNIYLGSFFDHPDDEGIKTIPLDSEYYNEQLEGKPVGQLFSAYRRDPSSGSYGTVGWAQYLGKDSHGRHRIGLINRGKLDKMFDAWGRDANAVVDMLQRTAGATEKSLLDMGTTIDAARVEAKQPESMWGRSADKAMMSATLTPQQLRAGALHADIGNLAEIINQTQNVGQTLNWTPGSLLPNIGDVFTNPAAQVAGIAAGLKLAGNIATAARAINGVDALSGVLSMGSQAALIPTVLWPVIKNMYTSHIETHPRQDPLSWSESPYMRKRKSRKENQQQAQPQSTSSSLPEFTSPDAAYQIDSTGGGGKGGDGGGGDPPTKKQSKTPRGNWMKRWWPFITGLGTGTAADVAEAALKESSEKDIFAKSIYYTPANSPEYNDFIANQVPPEFDKLTRTLNSLGNGGFLKDNLSVTNIVRMAGGAVDVGRLVAPKITLGKFGGALGGSFGLGTLASIPIAAGIKKLFFKDGIWNYITAEDLAKGQGRDYIGFLGNDNKSYLVIPFTGAGGTGKYTDHFLAVDDDMLKNPDSPVQISQLVKPYGKDENGNWEFVPGDWVITFMDEKGEPSMMKKIRLSSHKKSSNLSTVFGNLAAQPSNGSGTDNSSQENPEKEHTDNQGVTRDRYVEPKQPVLPDTTNVSDNASGGNKPLTADEWMENWIKKQEEKIKKGE